MTAKISLQRLRKVFNAGTAREVTALHEVTVEVDDAFAAANRQALALAEQRMSEVPGVRAVFGPAGLLDITADARGNTSARPVLARGGGAPTGTGSIEAAESEGEAARQRVVRRADAVGWFLTENGRQPWIVQGLQLTKDGVSPSISAATVAISLAVFVLLYGILAVVDGVLMVRFSRKRLDPAPAIDETGDHVPAMSY